MMDKKIKEEINKRLSLVFPNHPNFIKDFAKGQIYLYDSSLFGNEDENLEKGIFNEPPKFRCLHDNELRMVREVEEDHKCFVFFVIKQMTERGLKYWLFNYDPYSPKSDENNYVKDKNGNINPYTLVVDVGYEIETLPSMYVEERRLTIGDLEAYNKN